MTSTRQRITAIAAFTAAVGVAGIAAAATGDTTPDGPPSTIPPASEVSLPDEAQPPESVPPVTEAPATPTEDELEDVGSVC